MKRLFENKEWFCVVVLALLLTAAFFYQVFSGKLPVPSDVITGMYFPWLDYKWGEITQVPVRNSLLADAVSVTYPFKSLAVRILKDRQIPLWNPYAFGGYPLLASSTVAVLFPTIIFYLIFPFNTALTLQTAAQPLIAFFSMYLLMRHFRLEKLSSFFAAVSYSFGSFILIWLEWNSHATTCAFLPLLIYLEDNLIEKKNKTKWGTLFSLTVAVQIFAGYLPIVGFTFIALAAYLLIKGNVLKGIFQCAKYYFLGLTLSSIYLIPYLELISKSQRMAEKITANEALTSPWNIIGMVIPDFFGNPRTGNSWGNGNYLNIAIYIGVVGIIMAIIGLKNNLYRKEIKYALLLLVLVFLVVYTNPLSKLLFNIGIWGGTSNTMNRFLFVVNFALAVLAGYGFSSINKSLLSTKTKACLTVLFSIIGVDLFFVVADYLHLHTTLDITPDHVMVGLRNSILPIFITLITLAILIIDHKIRLKNVVTKLVLIVILVLELFRFGLKFNTFSPPKYLYPETPVLQYLAKYPNERFVSDSSILPANMWIPYRLESIGGYDAAYPMNVGKFIAAVNSGSAEGGPQSKSGTIDLPGSKLLGEANVRFVLVKKDSVLFKELIDKSKNTGYKLVFEDRSIAVIENTKSLPRAYFVPQTIIIKGDEVLSYLMSKDYVPGRVAITDEFEFQGDEINTNDTKIEYSRISNCKTEIKVSNSKDSFLVVLDTYFPGWKASIDQVPVELYKTNDAFMGLRVPAGNHIINLIYKPKSFYTGLLVSAFSVLVLVLISFLKFVKRIWQ